MDEIARAAGVSRQAVYLHFRSKHGLLLALVEHVDRSRDVHQRVKRLWAAKSALAGVEVAAELAAETNGEVHRIAMALDSTRRWDPDFRAAWSGRMRSQLARYRRLAGWLEQDGVLGKGWSRRDATALLWAVTSVATYDLLVVDRRISVRRYARMVAAMLKDTLQAPLDPAKRPKARSNRRKSPTASRERKSATWWAAR